MINLFKDKRGLEFKSAFFSIIIVSVIIIAAGQWVGDWNDFYNSDINYDLGDFNRLDNISATASSYQGNISVSSAAQGEDFEGTTLRSVFGFLSNIFKPFRIIFGSNGILNTLSNRLGLPSYILQALVTFMIISIIFALIAVLFRLPRTSA